MITTTDWEVLIIGRSYAGLSAALNLGRTRRSVLVVGSGGPRNGSVLHTHGLLTQDGAAPEAVVDVAERGLDTYPTVELAQGRVTALEAIDGGFRATIGARTTTAAKVILATGANDNPPPIPGLAEHWGRGVFTCPFCDGYEHSDQPLAVVGTPEFAAHLGRLLTRWSDDVTVFCADLDPTAASDLAVHGVRVDRRPVDRVIGEGGAMRSLVVAGDEVAVGAVFVGGLPTPNSTLAASLGCALDEHGFVVVDESRRTTVPGVWAIGDVANIRANMSMAITDGVIAGVACHAELFDVEWSAAVA